MDDNKKPSILPLLGVNFIGAFGMSLVMPFLIYLTNQFGGNAILYGILGATYSIFQTIGSPLLGQASDSYGRKRILFLTQFGTLISWFIILSALLIPIFELSSFNQSIFGSFRLTVPLLLLFLARALDGLTGGNVAVANAYLIDISTDANRAKNFGKMASSSNLGFIIGPALAGVLGSTSLKEVLPVLAAILISLVGLALIYYYLPESPSVNTKEKDRGFSLKFALSIPRFPSMLVLYFLIYLAFNTFYAAFPIHAANTLKWKISHLGIFFSTLSAMMIFVQIIILPKLAKYFKDDKLATVGSALMVGSFACLTSPQTTWIYLSSFLFALGNGIMWPSFLAILGRIGEPESRGYLQGVATSSGSIASIIGLLVGGYCYQSLEFDTFLLGSGVFFLVFLAMIMVFSKIQEA